MKYYRHQILASERFKAENAADTVQMSEYCAVQMKDSGSKMLHT